MDSPKKMYSVYKCSVERIWRGDILINYLTFSGYSINVHSPFISGNFGPNSFPEASEEITSMCLENVTCALRPPRRQGGMAEVGWSPHR